MRGVQELREKGGDFSLLNLNDLSAGPRNPTFTLQAASCFAPWIWSETFPRCLPSRCRAWRTARSPPGTHPARIPARRARSPRAAAQPLQPLRPNGSGCGSRGPSPPSRSPARRERCGPAPTAPLAQQGRERGSQRLSEDRMIFLVAGGSCPPAAAPLPAAERPGHRCGAWPPLGARHPRDAHGSCSTSAFPQSTPGAPAVLCSPQGNTKHHGQSWKHPQGARVPAKGLREGQSGQERQFCSRRSETLYAQDLPLFGSAGLAAAASPGAAPPAQHLLPAPPKSAGSRAMRPRGAAPRGPRSDPQLGQRHRFCVCASRGNGEARNRLKTIAQLRSSSFPALWIILVSQPCRLSVGAPSHPLGAGCPPALFEELSGAAPPRPKAPLPPQQRGRAKL